MKRSLLTSIFLGFILVLATLPNLVTAVEGSLVASWSMSNGQTTVTDSVGGYNGAVHGALWTPAAVVINSSGSSWVLGTGVLGGIEFDGKSYVEVADAPVFRSANFSVGFWICSDSSSDFANVMGKEYYVAGQQAGWIVCWGDENPRLMNFIVFSPSHAESTIRVPVDLGVWTHLVFTFDRQTIAGYKNGKLVGKVSSRGYLPANEPFRIGRAYGDGNFFDGILDNIFFYNSSMSEADVRDLYRSYVSSAQGDTSIELSQVSSTPGQENVVTARLKDQLGRVLVGAQVSFRLNDLGLGTSTTDARGYARVLYEPQDTGTYSLTAEFGGIDQYHGSTQTKQVTVANVFLQPISLGAIGTCALVVGVVLVVRWRRGSGTVEWVGVDQK